MGVPTPKFPTSVDDPIVQDDNFKIDKYYVAYVDSRLRAIEQAVLGITGGTGSGNATSIQGVPVNATAPTASGQVVRYNSLTGQYVPVRLTEDDVDPAFVPSLAFQAGGTSPVENGQTGIAPTFNGTPAPNDPTVTLYTIADNLGGAPVSRLGIANPFQGPSATYTAPSSPGSMIWTANVTKNGYNRNAQASIAVVQRYFVGQDTVTSATGATVAGANATLTGGGATATLTGYLANLTVGTVITTPASGTAKYVYVWTPTAATAYTWFDLGANVAFAMSRVQTNVTFANQFAVSAGFDLYRSTNPLTASFTFKRNT